MIFRFTASCADQNMPLEVKCEFRPGKQAQRARRIAVGQLLAILAAQSATVEATGDTEVRVHADGETWIIV